MRKRKLSLLPLEDRLAPAVGDLVHNLTPPGGSAYFGHALAMTSQYVAVGTSRDGTAGGFSGAVHLYNPATGGLLRSVLNPFPASNDGFGEAVALSGNLLAVGAPQDDLDGSNTGTAYLYNASTGTRLFTLRNPSPNLSTFEFFGCSVAIAGNIVFVGAYLDNTDAGSGGSVYRFNATTGALIDRLGSPSPAGGDYFGHSLAVSGDTLVVGAPLDEVTTPLNVGAAHLYTASTGAYLRSIANPEPDPSDWFGGSVGISGNNVVVGAHYEDNSAGVGAAYMFNASTGALVHTFVNPAPSNMGWFGRGVATAGNTVIVGAPYNDTGATDSGIAYIYSATTGGLLDVVNNPVVGMNDAFGWAVAASGNRVSAGGFFNGTGNAHIFEGLPVGAPDAINDTPSVAEDSVSARLAVLTNDVSADVGGLTVTGITQGLHGDVAISADGKAVEYTPDPDYVGSDSFTYTITDSGGSDTATVDVTVTSVNDDPTARDDQASLNVDAGPTAIPVLDNDDFAPDTGETLTITSVTQGSHGTVVITSGGTGLTYEPDAGYLGADAFTYTISDGNGGTDSAIVGVSIQNPPSNNPPDAADDSATLSEDGGAQSINVLSNDSIAPDTGETLKVITVTQGQHGTVAIAADRFSITYTPHANYAGSDSFLYAVSDGRGGVDFAAVNVSVTNDAADRLEVVTNPTTLVFNEGNAPVPVDAGLRVSQLNSGIKKAVVKIASGYVKGRDVLQVPKVLGLKAVFSPATGTLTLSGTPLTTNPEAILRSVQYKNASPAPVASVRTLTITVSDSLGIGDPATRKIQVIEQNTAPMLLLIGPTLKFTENGPAVAVATTIKPTDLDNTMLAGATVAITTGFVAGEDELKVTTRAGITSSYNASTGVLTLTGIAKIYDYTIVLKSVKYANLSNGPSLNARTLSFTATDGTDTSLPVTRIVTIAAVNDAPILDASGNPTLPDVAAGDQNPSGITVATLLGTSVTDPDGVALQGIAVTSITGTTDGAWQYSLDGGTNWVTITGVTSAKGLLLRGTDMIRFKPSATFHGPQAISYRAWDQTTGTAGQLATLGVGGLKSAFSLATETASVTVL